MTKEQRREIYWQAYIVSIVGVWEECYGTGLCHLIKQLTGCYDIYQSFADSYPELWVQRPKVLESLCYWYGGDESGWKKRRQALLKAIELTYK